MVGVDESPCYGDTGSESPDNNLRRPTAKRTKFRLWPIFHLETNCCFQTSLDSGIPLRAWQHEKILNRLPVHVKARVKTCDDSHCGVFIRTFSCKATWTISPELHLRSHRVVSAGLGLCGGISPHRCACWGKPHRGSRSSPSPGGKGTHRSTSPKHALRIKGRLQKLLNGYRKSSPVRQWLLAWLV